MWLCLAVRTLTLASLKRMGSCRRHGFKGDSGFRLRTAWDDRDRRVMGGSWMLDGSLERELGQRRYFGNKLPA